MFAFGREPVFAQSGNRLGSLVVKSSLMELWFGFVTNYNVTPQLGCATVAMSWRVDCGKASAGETMINDSIRPLRQPPIF
jgi:hypothetical protein